MTVSIKKQKKIAKDLLQAAHKVYCYRKDLLSESEHEDLEKAAKEVDDLIRSEKAEEKAMEASMNQLDALLRKIGGKIYPKTFWSDNLEVALTAAIIVIGIRTFFFQPFIIPTNSMYPTYSGMNEVIYNVEEAPPASTQRLFRFATLGARHKAIVAENSGGVVLDLHLNKRNQWLPYREAPAKKWFIFNTTVHEYTFTIDGKQHSLKVPREFDMSSVLEERFGDIGSKSATRTAESSTGFGIPLDYPIEKGESLLRFDITLGDALFVDRISYHFKRPKAGDPFVFRTRNIPGIEGDRNQIVDKYYIKRIGGVGGETLEIVDGVLLADGEPRDEVEAFERNASREGEYDGYVNYDYLARGRELPIPEGDFVALGDNSNNSRDSRYWGTVPEKAVIGKAIFIYYPFTKRWGVAE